MKRILVSLLLISTIASNLFAQYPDLPGVGGNYNVQTLPAGSYVIAMDNKNQGSGTGTFTVVVNNRNFNYTAGNPIITATTNTTGILTDMEVTGQGAIPAGAVVTAVTATTVTLNIAPTVTQSNKSLDFGNTTYSGADFNLKAYGLLITLLNNNIKLKWIIKPGKVGDAVDFSVNATRIKPGLGSPTNIDFAAGPFVIFAPDTTGVAALVQNYNGPASADDVKMYVTNAATTVDVRYDYFFNGSVWKPRIGVLNDGGNAGIHTSYLENAGVPAGNYSVEATAAFITNCYTFASEPHNTNAPPAVIQGIRSFVQNGSNFLAQCAAVRTYELSTLARFQSTNGFDNANENGGPSTWSYSNADLAYFQINGYFGISDNGGSLQNWVIPEAPTNPAVNNFHVYNSGSINGFNYTNASVAKLRPGNERGGMVFYLGSHSYNGNADYDVNGQRLYMNAVMVPTQASLKTTMNFTCASPVNTSLTVNVTSTDGPWFAYPLNFKVYKDLPPLGYNAGDILTGNTVVMTAPNIYQGGISQVTVPSANVEHYVLVITPTNGCKPADILIPCPPLTVVAVGLNNFTAVRKKQNVELNWSSPFDPECKGFGIERSLDKGNSWQAVGFVNSGIVNGTANTPLNYLFNDPNTFKNISNYRLRQTAFNGQFKLTEIRSVIGLGESAEVMVYPNPSRDGRFNIMSGDEGIYDISVIAMSGRIVKKINGVKGGNAQIDRLEKGVYILKLFNLADGKQLVRKLVVN